MYFRTCSIDKPYFSRRNGKSSLFSTIFAAGLFHTTYRGIGSSFPLMRIVGFSPRSAIKKISSSFIRSSRLRPYVGRAGAEYSPTTLPAYSLPREGFLFTDTRPSVTFDGQITLAFNPQTLASWRYIQYRLLFTQRVDQHKQTCFADSLIILLMHIKNVRPPPPASGMKPRTLAHVGSTISVASRVG
mgnify:CR=1 FL=1